MNRLITAAAVLLSVSACATLDAPSKSATSRDSTWQLRHQQLAGLNYWHIDGRIGVKTRDDGGTISLRWTQDGSNYEIRLFGAFGKGIAVLKGDADSATLETAEGEILEADDAETLFAHQFGWWIPVKSLQQWVLGLPGDVDEYRLDEQARLESLRHGPWELQVLAYTQPDKLELPKRIKLQTADLSLRLAVDGWLFKPESGKIGDTPRPPTRPLDANAK